MTVGGKEYYIGYTKQYIKAAVPADDNYENMLLSGVLTEEVEPHVLLLKKQK